MALDITAILNDMIGRGASDLHLKVGRPPLMRVAGDLLPTEYPTLDELGLTNIMHVMMPEKLKASYAENAEADFSYAVPDLARFRVNTFRRLGLPGAVIRAIPLSIPKIESLGLPVVIKDMVQKRQGLILVTGPTSSGKSTSLSSMVNHINETRHCHIVTIEDPVEFVYSDNLATINQRELGTDTSTYEEALRRALRQDPDVILIGELRDARIMEIAIEAAETGHLVLTTLHTNDAKQTLDRILDSFPADEVPRIRGILSLVLIGVISQRLLKRADGDGRVAAVEVLVNSPHIRQLLEEGSIKDLDKAMAKSSSYYRMQTFNQALCALVQDHHVVEEEALGFSASPDDLKRMIRGVGAGSASLEPGTGIMPPPAAKKSEHTNILQQLQELDEEAMNARKKEKKTAPPSEGRPKINRGFDL